MSERSSDLRVGVIMGSDSDLGTMRHVGRALTQLGLKSTVDYEERVISVHRTTELAHEYAATAESRGLRVIVAGAGGSAHLPGIVASETTVPVLGVAITKNPEVMNRALGSMIGMPEGKPLAVFQGETGAFNAGLFAAKFLFAAIPELQAQYRLHQSAMSSDVRAKDRTLQELGAEEYLRINPPKAK
jgi:phosphoribosylaminoimidazole carboxylase PurE protein